MFQRYSVRGSLARSTLRRQAAAARPSLHQSTATTTRLRVQATSTRKAAPRPSQQRVSRWMPLRRTLATAAADVVASEPDSQSSDASQPLTEAEQKKLERAKKERRRQEIVGEQRQRDIPVVMRKAYRKQAARLGKMEVYKGESPQLFHRYEKSGMVDQAKLTMQNSKAISDIKKLLPEFSRGQFRDEIAETYKEVNEIIAKGKYNNMREHMTRRFFNVEKRKVKAMIQERPVNVRFEWECEGLSVSILQVVYVEMPTEVNERATAMAQITVSVDGRQRVVAFNDVTGEELKSSGSDKTKISETLVYERNLSAPTSRWRLCDRL